MSSLMRAVLLTVFLTACSTNSLPNGDGGGRTMDLSAADLTASGTMDLAADLTATGTDLLSPVDLASVDLAGPPPGETCVSTCNRCSGGGCCGAACCAAGEWCDATLTCRCGTGPACAPNLICARGGPVMPGGGQCGFVCCGDATHPCPL
jgi:hypothetical protein